MIIGVPFFAVIYDVITRLVMRGLRYNQRDDMLMAYDEQYVKKSKITPRQEKLWSEEEKQERNHFFREVMDALKDHDESGYYITREIKVHERSEKEVASEMGITIGNLRVKMTRTKKWLCQHFADKARERGFL